VDVQMKFHQGFDLIDQEMKRGGFEYDMVYKTRPDLMMLEDVSMMSLFNSIVKNQRQVR